MSKAAIKAAAGRFASVLQLIKFNDQGLVPTIAQQHDTGEVLMLAWMNRDAVLETLATNRACYFSRSRGKLWRKGESSGQTQAVIDFRIDCDGDTILLLVEQTGPACHTGRRNCFFHTVKDDRVAIDGAIMVDPKTLYGER
ncbi:MAG: phosphoribosyl-AMP cyclohydrolase [Alphaproteobacteria bacterium]